MKLLGFQKAAVSQVITAMNQYDGNTNISRGLKDSHGLEDGEEIPCLHRIKAITGAGKTAILASLAGKIGPSVVLWTTPSSAVIGQTAEGLSGKYAAFLRRNTRIHKLSEMTNLEWDLVLGNNENTDIIVATVASFNQDGETLKIHQGENSRWQQMVSRKKGGERYKPLHIFYDESHNATSGQIEKLVVLRPQNIILASASPLPGSLLPLIPGSSDQAKQSFIPEITTEIPTKKVVKENLLKPALALYDLSVPWEEMLAQAVRRRAELEVLAKACPDKPLACYMVNSTQDGIEVWKQLVAIGVNPALIAVHLNRATIAMRALSEGEAPSEFCDTYSGKGEKATPKELRTRGFQHLIWNHSLEEGWDEPWAYVGYLHGRARKSEVEIVQRIGRFLRNPFYDQEGKPCEAPHKDLGTAHFYMSRDNTQFAQLLEEVKNSIEGEGIDVIIDNGSNSTPGLTVSPVVGREFSIPVAFVRPSSGGGLSREFLRTIKSPDKSKANSEGTQSTATFNLKTGGSTSQQEKTSRNYQISVEDAVREACDDDEARLVSTQGSEGAWLSPDVWKQEWMSEMIDYNSAAHQTLKRDVQDFCTKVSRHIVLESAKHTMDFYRTGSITLHRPNFKDGTSKDALRKVRSYKNSVHPTYNGLNNLEIAAADALDATGLTWLRNEGKSSYSLPLYPPKSSGTRFYPDFVLKVSDSRIVLLETKGEHLLETDLPRKLFLLPKPLQVYFLSEHPENTMSPFSLTWCMAGGIFTVENYPSMEECLDEIRTSAGSYLP